MFDGEQPPYPPIDRRYVEEFLAMELRSLQKDSLSISREQGLRAFSIAWICTFLPELVSLKFLDRLTKYLRLVRQRSDHSSSEWHKILPLEIAAFSLSGDRQHLYSARFNYDHHNTSMRWVAMGSLAFVVDQLYFSDSELQPRAEYNLYVGHMAAAESVLLLLHTRGSDQEKRTWLESCRVRFPSCEASETITAACSGRSVPNTWFLAHFRDVERYVMSKLLLELSHVENRRRIGQLALPLRQSLPFPNVLWHRLEEHPLMNAFLQPLKAL